MRKFFIFVLYFTLSFSMQQNGLESEYAIDNRSDHFDKLYINQHKRNICIRIIGGVLCYGVLYYLSQKAEEFIKSGKSLKYSILNRNKSALFIGNQWAKSLIYPSVLTVFSGFCYNNISKLKTQQKTVGKILMNKNSINQERMEFINPGDFEELRNSPVFEHRYGLRDFKILDLLYPYFYTIPDNEKKKKYYADCDRLINELENFHKNKKFEILRLQEIVDPNCLQEIFGSNSEGIKNAQKLVALKNKLKEKNKSFEDDLKNKKIWRFIKFIFLEFLILAVISATWYAKDYIEKKGLSQYNAIINLIIKSISAKLGYFILTNIDLLFLSLQGAIYFVLPVLMGCLWGRYNANENALRLYCNQNSVLITHVNRLQIKMDNSMDMSYIEKQSEMIPYINTSECLFLFLNEDKKIMKNLGDKIKNNNNKKE